MVKYYGMLGVNSSEAQWIRSYKESQPSASIEQVAEVFRRQTNPQGDIEQAKRIVRVYLGLDPQESIDDLVPDNMK